MVAINAFVINEVGSPPKLQKLIPIQKSPQQVEVEILASSLNHRDIWVTKGLYPGIRFGSIMGSDACVVYDNNKYIINPGLDWGQNQRSQGAQFRVLGVPDDGTFAERIWIDPFYLHEKPSFLTDIQAAALPLAGVTAFRALFYRAQLTANDRVLINGVGGGVATFALQYAIALGCEVVVTSGQDEKIEKAISLGALKGYNYKDENWPQKMLHEFGPVDVIIDSAGGEGFNNLVKVADYGARISFYGGTNGAIPKVNPQVIFWKQISLLGSTMGSPQDFKDMINFVNNHKIVPIIDEVFSFDDLVLGFNKMEENAQMGKIVFRHS